MGLSAAWHTANKLGDGSRILVVERDLQYKQASCVLSAGGIRQQFSDAPNIAMSLYGIDFIRNTERWAASQDEVPDLQFCEGGYLFLGTENSVTTMVENNSVQHGCGCDWINLMDRRALEQKFPWMNLHDIALGSFGSKNEGSLTSKFPSQGRNSRF